MILRFRHKGLEAFFRTGSTKGIDARQAARLQAILSVMNQSTSPRSLALPGLRLHPLKGVRHGQWAVAVSGNWRIVFRFEAADITDVDLVDYH